MRRIIKVIMRNWAWMLIWPMRMVKGKRYGNLIVQMFMKEICREAEHCSDMYISHTLRPKAIKNCRLVHTKRDDTKIAVILQGPLVDKDNFTLNTVRYYRKCKPNLVVIVSTWDGEKAETVNSLEKAGAYVIQSPKPARSGHRNINYQLISMQAGIKKAIELGMDYICKTRTDQRIENPYAFTLMRNMIKIFPVSGSSHLQGRIVALGAEFGSMFIPYYISDFIYFGLREDMALMLSIPLDNRSFPNRFMNRKMIAEKKASPESYIIKTLFEESGTFYDNTIKDYWKSIKESLILLDMSILELYWPKYDERYCEHIRSGIYSVNRTGEIKRRDNFNFSSWLSLMMNDISYDEEYEKFLDLPQML